MTISTRAKWESEGLSLRTPRGERILEVPAEFGWDYLDLRDRAEILKIFGFDGGRAIVVTSEPTGLGTQFQFSQETIMASEFNLAESLGITTDMGKLALDEALENAKLLDRKHKDYGPGNISKFGYQGVVVRMSDKLERLINLNKQGGGDPQFESVEDTLRDIANYAVIGTLCLKRKWK